MLNRSAVRYDERMKEWLAAYKYRRNERLRDLLAAMLYRSYKRHETDFTRTGAVHLITYVPVSLQRLEERGFNQAERLAAWLGVRTGISVVGLLKRRRDTAQQSYKGRAERITDLHDVFVWDDDALNWILTNTPERPINILIIDDVYTTGSTLHHCAATLAEKVDANVYGLTWAR
ncbi:ComF family protein [Paenibacillus hodogayensis]|uniref:ComF family protein n=1 Tax=Paenibacillus hodogayensis TaxID=279208 RepID=A0ABV5W7Y6_9BACL